MALYGTRIFAREVVLAVKSIGYYSNNRWAVLAVLVVVPFMVTLDGTVVNAALPVMAKDLDVSMESIQTVAVAYLTAVVASILLFGRLGDAKGKGRIFIFGVAVFTIGSFMASLSRDLPMLNAARVIEGVGGAAAMANNQGIITEVFPAGERGRALGVSGVFAAIGTMCGPPVGVFIVAHLSWNHIFMVNIPIGLACFVAALKMIPAGEKARESIDIPGAAFLASAVVAFFYGLLNGQMYGYMRADIVAAFIMSKVLLVLFVLREGKCREPILDLSLFRNGIFTISIICVLIQFVVSGGISIILPFFMEKVLGHSAGQIGFILMSLPIAMGVTLPISGYLSDRFGRTDSRCWAL
jgi:EmrB/QacA subfamily drug resistance transporter